MRRVIIAKKNNCHDAPSRYIKWFQAVVWLNTNTCIFNYFISSLCLLTLSAKEETAYNDECNEYRRLQHEVASSSLVPRLLNCWEFDRSWSWQHGRRSLWKLNAVLPYRREAECLLDLHADRPSHHSWRTEYARSSHHLDVDARTPLTDAGKLDVPQRRKVGYTDSSAILAYVMATYIL